MRWEISANLGVHARANLDARGWLWEITRGAQVARVVIERSGSTKRCATAVGEGAMAVQLVHARLAERQQVQRTAAT